MHTKTCLANQMIRAIKTLRDDPEETDFEFRIAAQDNYFLIVADDFLKVTGNCKCPKHWGPWGPEGRPLNEGEEGE